MVWHLIICAMIHVLPPFKYDLRRNRDPGVLLTSPEVRTKKTSEDRSFSCAVPIDFGTFFYLIWGLFPVWTFLKEDLNLFIY